MGALDTSLQYIKGIGPHFANVLVKLQLVTVRDFLFFFPKSYDDRRQLPHLNQLPQGEVVTAFGQIVRVIEHKAKKMSLIKAAVTDGRTTITLVWFNQPYLKKVVVEGRWLIFRGKVERATLFETEVSVQDAEFYADVAELQTQLGRVVPVYPTVSGMPQKRLRQFAQTIIPQFVGQVDEPFPEGLRQTYKLKPLPWALQTLHFPKGGTDFLQARKRLVFEEFFFLQLSLLLKRKSVKQPQPSPILQTQGPLIEAYLSQLSYALTQAQCQAIADVAADVQTPTMMNRLLQGDVGSGKTDVALMAALFAIQSGLKAAVMVPTEILAQQHFFRFQERLSPLGIETVLIKGKPTAKEKKANRDRLAAPEPCVVIGTHALLEEGVLLANLGLMVVDEQHRFGVLQRLNLRNKGGCPHCLFMTATPIPRSLSLTYFGNLEKSIIGELPPGRTPPKTLFFKEESLDKVYRFCAEQLAKGRQVYVVYPLVEESEKLDLKSAIEGFETLQQTVFKAHKVGLIHGKLPAAQKQAIMAAFKARELDVLVATTVIEVGIDVPNASVMVIQHAERFGLSVLHQLRGRIGRGPGDSFCFLIADPKTDTAKQRIKALLSTTDGFKLAEHDLQIRGPGDVLGIRQSGLPDFKVGDLVRDQETLAQAHTAATAVWELDPRLQAPQHRGLRQTLLSSYKSVFEVELD